MKRILIPALFAAALLQSVNGMAAGDHDHNSHQMAQVPMTAETQMNDGVVKKIDKAAGMVTLAHGALTNLGMPAMTMAYRVKENSWLDKMKEGDKIRFVADNVNGAMTVVNFESTK